MNDPKISAFLIHEWVYTTLKLQEDDILMLQIDCPISRFYIKFVSNKMFTHPQNIQGTHEYKHANGEMSLVEVSPAGLGYRSVRVAGLPSEVRDTTVFGSVEIR
jgi:hypothetical protein